jgi:hypothetical protein
VHEPQWSALQADSLAKVGVEGSNPFARSKFSEESWPSRNRSMPEQAGHDPKSEHEDRTGWHKIWHTLFAVRSHRETGTARREG